MDKHVLDTFDDAQRRGWALMKDVVDHLEVGMSEADIAAQARSRAGDHGFDRWFHPPEVQVGDNTKNASIWKIPSGSNTLAAGDLVVITLGPSDADAYADVGTTVCFGREEPAIVAHARECVRAMCGFTSRWKTVGELYVYARAYATNNCLDLLNQRSVGHALLPKEGLLAGGFPQSAHFATWLRRYQVHFLNPQRIQGLWAYRPLLGDETRAAAFEEVVYIVEDEKRILGRSSIDEVGTV